LSRRLHGAPTASRTTITTASAASATQTCWHNPISVSTYHRHPRRLPLRAIARGHSGSGRRNGHVHICRCRAGLRDDSRIRTASAVCQRKLTHQTLRPRWRVTVTDLARCIPSDKDAGQTESSPLSDSRSNGVMTPRPERDRRSDGDSQLSSCWSCPVSQAAARMTKRRQNEQEQRVCGVLPDTKVARVRWRTLPRRPVATRPAQLQTHRDRVRTESAARSPDIATARVPRGGCDLSDTGSRTKIIALQPSRHSDSQARAPRDSARNNRLIGRSRFTLIKSPGRES
jgi:hypothetical protein